MRPDVEINIDVQQRLVSFTQRPKLSIHPVTITVPWAALKTVTGHVLLAEAQMDAGVVQQQANAGRPNGGPSVPSDGPGILKGSDEQ